MPESGRGRRCPRPAVAVRFALTWWPPRVCRANLVAVNAAASTRRRSTSAALQEAAGPPGRCGCTPSRGVDQRARRGRPRARSSRRGGRPPDRRARPARPRVGDAARRRADVLRRRRPGGGRRVVAAGPARRRVRRGPGAWAGGSAEVAQRRAGRTTARSAGSWSERVRTRGGRRWRWSASGSTSTRPRTSCRCRRPPRSALLGARSTAPSSSADVLHGLRVCAGRDRRAPRARSWTDYRGRSATLGRDVRVDLPGRTTRRRARRPASTHHGRLRRRDRRGTVAARAPAMSFTCAPRSDRLPPWPSHRSC